MCSSDLVFPFPKESRKTVIKNYLQIIIGSFIVAIAYVFFFTPHKIIPGGVYGISIILHYESMNWFPWLKEGLPLGTTALCFNIPLIIVAFKLFGNSYLMRTIVTFVSTAVFVDLLSEITPSFSLVNDLNGDMLLSCIYGSAILGFGVAQILKAHGTSAGTDVLAKVLTKYTRIPVGYTIIIVDSFIVLLGLIAFGDWRIPMYSLFTVFVYGKMVDVFMQGLSFNKAVFIISDKHEIIAERIMHSLNRGGTYFYGKGMYQGTPKEIIYTVIDSKQVSTLRQYVQEIDPNAFITIIEAKEILGTGFKAIDEQ